MEFVAALANLIAAGIVLWVAIKTSSDKHKLTMLKPLIKLIIYGLLGILYSTYFLVKEMNSSEPISRITILTISFWSIAIFFFLLTIISVVFAYKIQN